MSTTTLADLQKWAPDTKFGDRYINKKHITRGGKRFNAGMAAHLDAVNVILQTSPYFGRERENISITQGSYNNTVAQSAGTHGGGGSADLSAYNWTNRSWVIRLLGGTGSKRRKISGVWNDHIHTILCGDGTAAPLAQRQVTSYYNGRDGLKGNGRDPDRRPKVLPILFVAPWDDRGKPGRYTVVERVTLRDQPHDQGVDRGAKKVGDTVDIAAVINVKGELWAVTTWGDCVRKKTIVFGVDVEPTPVPEPTPEPKPEPIPEPNAEPTPTNDIVANFGYGNIGPTPYITTPTSRAQIQAMIREITTCGASLFVLLEAHEENGSRGVVAFIRSILPDHWVLIEGRGGNHLLIDKNKYQFLAAYDRLLSIRWATKWNLSHIATGVPFWVVGYHAPAGASRAASRALEARRLIEWTKTLHRVVFAVDKNNYAAYKGSLTKAFKDSGRVSVYAAVKVENGEWNSHGTKRQGRHIDDMLTGSLATFRWGRQHRTKHLSGPDHDWIVAGIRIKGV